MMGRRPRGTSLSRWMLVWGLLAMPAIAWSQTTPAAVTSAEYVIGVEDVLQISVWSHTELDRTVSVDSQGNISLPPVGDIKAAGLTSRALADRISDRLSSYLRQGATTVTVLVRDYVSQSVYVSGAVARPGRYGAISPPRLFDAINLAGGALTSADLSRVTIIRRAGTGPHQLTADVASALRDGTESQLPELRPGDLVVIPASVSLIGGVGNEEGVGVLGEVGRPGLYPVSPNEDLWMALALAGGPTNKSNLSTIRVLTIDQANATAVTVNLRETLERGNRHPYIVKPGDIVFVDSKGISTWGAFLSVLGVTRDVASMVAVVRVLQKNP